MSSEDGVVPLDAKSSLRQAVQQHLDKLGLTASASGCLELRASDKSQVRALHRSQREEKLAAAEIFLKKSLSRALPSFAQGSEIDPRAVRLALRRVTSGTPAADLFRVATLTWSVPVSAGFGRRMRYLVWDEAHDRLAGVIALGDPVFNLSVRDNAIGWSARDRMDRLAAVLDAYVLGAVPPYNFLLAGKAIACLIRSRDIYEDFGKAYGDREGIISGQVKSPALLAITTTSSMGRSSVYNRLKIDGVTYLRPLGFTKGWGHFHVGAALFDSLRAYLRGHQHAYVDAHGFGEGPNWRLRTIKAALAELGMDEGLLRHGVQRQVFIAELAANATDILRSGIGEPEIRHLRTVAEISDLARDRWIVPRSASTGIEWQTWSRESISALIYGDTTLPTVREAA